MAEPKHHTSREQIQQIEGELERLNSEHGGVLGHSYREFFNHAKEIAQLFKQSHAVPHLERQRLWTSFNSICDSMRVGQTRHLESRANDSRIKKDGVESDIREAFHWAKGSNSISDLREAERMLSTITEKMKDGWGGFTGTTELLSFSEGKLTKEDRDFLWSKWREAKDAVRERREWLSELNYDHLRSVAEDCLELAHSEPRAAKERIKQAHLEMKQKPVNSTQYADVRRTLDKAWETASKTASGRHHEWRSRMEDHLQRWTELLEKNEDVVAKVEEQIEDCQEMEANSRSDEFAETVRGWIEEKMNKIRAIRNTNESLEERIESVKKKLGP